MMQETVTAGTSKIILTSREELEGCIYAAVRTIITLRVFVYRKTSWFRKKRKSSGFAALK